MTFPSWAAFYYPNVKLVKRVPPSAFTRPAAFSYTDLAPTIYCALDSGSLQSCCSWLIAPFSSFPRRRESRGEGAAESWTILTLKRTCSRLSWTSRFTYDIIYSASSLIIFQATPLSFHTIGVVSTGKVQSLLQYTCIRRSRMPTFLRCTRPLIFAVLLAELDMQLHFPTDSAAATV